MSTRPHPSSPPSKTSVAATGGPDDRSVALAVMHVMRVAQADGRRITALDLAQTLEVRRTDVRRVVSDLDRRGLVDALRMRLTLLGFAYVTSSAAPSRGRTRAPNRPDVKVLRAA